MSASISPLLSHLLVELPKATLSALAETELWVEETRYAIVAVPSEEKGALFSALGDAAVLITIDDGDEFTIVISEEDLDALPPLFSQRYQVEHRYRFIRLEATLPWDVVGYGAAVFTALAGVGVSAGFYSGYSIDYLLVNESVVKKATGALEALFREARRLEQAATRKKVR
ncbi:MAG: ACT domain-containing protein [Caldilineae bacterium]|nr:MAG: ACT domain-containing protein [Caldilineae bacterium]